MGEIESKPGVFISVITKEKWLERTSILKGPDLTYYVSQCNPAWLAGDAFIDIIGVGKKELYELCRKLEPEFNPETDYYVIRIAEPNRRFKAVPG